MDSGLRSLIKGITWRILGTLASAGLFYYVSKDFTLAAKFGIIDSVIKLVLYYFHERTWLRTKWGIK